MHVYSALATRLLCWQYTHVPERTKVLQNQSGIGHVDQRGNDPLDTRCSDASLVDVQDGTGCIGSIMQESGVHTEAIPSGGTPCGGRPKRNDQQG